MRIKQYLQRIRYQGPLEPNLATLQGLHEAHLLSVPFENLDIYQGREIVLDEPALWTKIVEHRRGGFCYELNGLFAWLLRALGFQVQLLSARVATGAERFGPEFDHLTLLVTLEQDWLADVGFGESYRWPLLLQDSLVHEEPFGKYCLLREQQFWTLQHWDYSWKPEYCFTLQPHVLSDFAAMCRYQQSSPASHFTQKRICSIATSYGRVSLSEQRLIITKDGQHHERWLSTQDEYTAALAEYFGVVL
ncbi:arylamine N-acetyltransferase [Ktedonosporobacter rubrisoli]|uniref:Arylamine N-acetyltransferase n=1 Tax=Ktedonosporobacter rubrisoli TaxID=2509675 RepID=A0A4P6JKJ2_KTERU|nr:arylamine N-acetyltransferase [Ktedonosporobacter rubrisoli]QBD75707.1 arylamine N-acetyltransferase [Ktedonosporobacter rubrisoli]